MNTVKSFNVMGTKFCGLTMLEMFIDTKIYLKMNTVSMCLFSPEDLSRHKREGSASDRDARWRGQHLPVQQPWGPRGSGGRQVVAFIVFIEQLPYSR